VPEKPGIEELMASVVATKNSQRRRNGPAKISETHFAREIDVEMIMGEGGAGASSVVSGLASPATSLSDEDLSDDEGGEGY
jgi:hypothetical protein